MSYEESNKQSDVVPHGFIHCTEGSQGLDLETLLLSVKDHWPFDGWTQLCACLALVKMNASGVWRPQWEASPVQRGAGQGGHWMVTLRSPMALALSPMAPSFWSQSQGGERLVMLPVFLGVPICRGGLNEHSYCFWIRWGPRFSRVTLDTFSSQTHAHIWCQKMHCLGPTIEAVNLLGR